MINKFVSVISMLCVLFCAACSSIGPDYVRPTVDLPKNWKSVSGEDSTQWKPTQPSDSFSKQEWWKIFGDDKLNELETLSLQGNFSLQAAVARLDQVLAQSKARTATQYPTVQLGAGAARTRISANRPLTNYNSPNYSTVQDDYRPILSVSYEFDWLGKVRRDIESAHASAEQAEADKENVRLLLTAQVAAVYFQLRQLDEEISIVSTSVALQDKVLGLISKRYKLGASGRSDLAQQAALFENSNAQLELLIARRNQQENALATLIGTPAPVFRLSSGKLPATIPSIPVAVPSTLLERRPDIASAERAMAASNAQIGVAKAAFFPSLNLAPTYGGYESNTLSNLFSTPSLVWSVGILATQTLFDGGRINANIDFAKAGYTATVANYRQTALTAMQETQDSLNNLHQLGLAKHRQDEAVNNWNKAYQISLIRYKEGLDNSITLATIQQNQLAAKRTQTQIRGNQFLSAVGLIKALGGGWQSPKACHSSSHASNPPHHCDPGQI